MKSTSFKKLLAGFAVFGMAVASQALPIPYDKPGTEAPVTYFTATGNGLIYLTAYFYATDAGYDSEIGMLVNGVSTGIYGLPNHSSVYGQPLALGYANAGDSIVFELRVWNTSSSWFTDPSRNSDGLNHAYSTYFPGDNIIPEGIYVGFEDLPGLGDVDYNDHQFVFTGVSNNRVPDGGLTFSLLGMALAGAALVRRSFRA